MVGSMLKRLAVTAAVAVAGFAGAATAAQASPTWTNPGDFDAEGIVTLVTPSGGQFSCSISYAGTADNTGGVARSGVRDVSFTNCYTTVPGCSVSMVAKAPSTWSVEASGSSAPFRLEHTVSIDVLTSGAFCSNGVYFSASGTFGGDFTSPAGGSEGYVWFDGNAESLSSPVWGAIPIDGLIGFYPAAGGDQDLT